MGTSKVIFILYVFYAITWAAGCVVVKEANVTNSEFNSAGWKSQAGVSGDAVIEATTTPKTDISAAGL